MQSSKIASFLVKSFQGRSYSTRVAIELFHKLIDTQSFREERARESEREREREGSIDILEASVNKSLDLLLSRTIYVPTIVVNVQRFLKIKLCIESRMFKIGSKVASYPQYPRFKKKKKQDHRNLVFFIESNPLSYLKIRLTFHRLQHG